VTEIVVTPEQSVDDIIAVLEAHNLGWSLDHTGCLIEARIWEWPSVIGRYRPHAVEPLADMLRAAIATIDGRRAYE
jgi:hypothetical protein